MSLSTSNFKTEAKVIGLVVVVLVSVELGVHIFEKRMAVGFNTPKASEAFVNAEGRRVLVLGNSLVRNGVDVKLLEGNIQAQIGSPVRVGQAFLVAASMSDWYYIFKSSFIDTRRVPDTLVLFFAYDYLQDAPIQRSFVAHYYSSVNDIPQLFTDEVTDFDGRAEFLLFKASLSFSQRTSLHRRASDVLIPHYRENALRINKALSEESSSGNIPRETTYRYLEKFINIARENNVQVILVAMPTQKSYLIDPQLIDITEAHGVKLFDNRSVEGLMSEQYGDDSHLNDSGKAIYSRFLAEELVTFH